MLSSWRTCPNVKPRRKVPNVDGARTPDSRRRRPPCRNRSMSSIESAPATIPATRQPTFAAGSAAPAPAKANRCVTSRPRPHRCTSDITGANPAHDTRFGSSKRAETPCETCIYRVPS